MSQPVAIEMIPTSDRSCVMIVMRSNEAIPMSGAIDTLEKFTVVMREKLVAKFEKKILTTTPSIIIP